MNPITTECCHIVNTKRWLSPAAHLSACDRGQGLRNKPEIKAEKRRLVTKKLQKMLNDWINYGQIYNDISNYARLDLFPAQTDDVSPILLPGSFRWFHRWHLLVYFPTSIKCAASSETPLTLATDSLPSPPLGGATGFSGSGAAFSLICTFSPLGCYFIWGFVVLLSDFGGFLVFFLFILFYIFWFIQFLLNKALLLFYHTPDCNPKQWESNWRQVSQTHWYIWCILNFLGKNPSNL